MNAKILALILCLSLTQCASGARAPSSAASSVLSSCVDVAIRMFAAQDPYLGEMTVAKKHIRESFKSLDKDYEDVTLLDNHLFFLLSKNFKKEEIEELISINGRAVNPRELQNRLEFLGLSLEHYPSNFQSLFLSEYKRQWEFKKSSPRHIRETFLKKFKEAQTLELSELESLTKDLELRKERAWLRKTLEDPQLFRSKIEGKFLVFADGAKLEIREHKKNGVLVVLVPVEQVIPSQGRIWQDKVLEYMGNKKLSKMVFEGDFYPDGRVQILDQHHRISAYAQKVSNLVPFKIGASVDSLGDASGEFYYQTSSYMKAVAFNQGSSLSEPNEFWEFSKKVRSIESKNLSKSQREQELRAVQRDYYSKRLGLRPVQ